MNNNELVIVRTFKAPREAVWQAWTDPERLRRWWGPKGFTAPTCSIDLLEGGKYLFCMRSPEGEDFWSTGVYRKIEPPSLLACSDSFADAAGNVVPATYYGMGADFPLELEIRVTFEGDAGITLMTLRHAGIPPGEVSDMCKTGWEESFDKLEASLAS